MRRHRLVTGHVAATLDLPDQLSITPEVRAEADVTLPGGWTLETLEDTYTWHPDLVVTTTAGAPSVNPLPADAVHVALRPTAAASVTLAYVTYTALERRRQHQGMVTMHGSGVSVPGRGAVLLLGDKGSGKTATLLALTERGCVPAGDDLLVLRSGPGHLELLPSRRAATVRGAGHGELYYEHKYRQLLDHDEFLRLPTKIDRVVRVNVHCGAAAPAVRQLIRPPDIERLRLHENLGRYISGLPTPLGLTDRATEGRVWPLDDDRCAALRNHIIELLCKAPFHVVQARSAEEAAELILTSMR